MTLEQLDDWYYMKKMIERLDEELHILENRMLDTGGAKYYDTILAQIVEKNNEKADITSEIERIEAFIMSLRPREQLIIRYRFEEGLTWEQIAERIGYSKSPESCAHILYRILQNTK